MDLFTYLMAKNGHNTSVHGDLFSYLLGKGQSQTYTVSGVTIYIPNAKKLVSLIMTKESTQDGEPTPDYPQEVKTVKGYRNLFDYEMEIGFIASNGNSVSSSSDIRTKDYILFNGNNKNYFLSNEDNLYNYIYKYDVNKSYIGRTGTFPAIIEDNCKYIKIVVRNTTNLNEKIQLVEGDQELPYVPYGNNYILYKQVGKNLLSDMTAYNVLGASTYYRANSLTPITSPYTTSGGYRGVGFVAPVKAGVTYVFSSDISNVSVRGVSIYSQLSDITNSNNQLEMFANANTFTPTYDGYALLVFLIATSGTTMTWSNAQLEVGTTATAYEAYKESNVPIPLNNNEIVGIGDYKDELKVDKSGHVFINKKTRKVVLNGSENWIVSTSFSNPTYSVFVTNDFNNSFANNKTIFSNYFVNNNRIGRETTTQEGIGYFSNVYGLRVSILKATVDAVVNDWKTWLSTHNTDVYYVLAQENLIDLQTTVDLSLFKGVNNVSNSVDGYMTIEYK